MGFLWSQLFVTPAYPKESFAGRVVIVTGSNVGLGKEAVRHFVRLNAAKVILAVRNLQAGEEAKKDIETTERRPGACEVWKLDLGDFDSVKAFAARANDLPRLDAVVENAGIATDKFRIAAGHESTNTVNVISTFLLALLLLPRLRANAKEFPGAMPSLSIVTSEVHGFTSFEEEKANSIFGTMDNEKEARMDKRYMISKLLEVLAVRQIAPQIAGQGVVLNMLNPGLCKSELARNANWQVKLLKLLLARTTEVGSRTLVAAATAGSSSHGAYMTDGLVDNGATSSYVRSDAGAQAQVRVWRELADILEGIQPGVTANLKA